MFNFNFKHVSPRFIVCLIFPESHVIYSILFKKLNFKILIIQIIFDFTFPHNLRQMLNLQSTFIKH
jgi:hypothetical protein